MTGDPPPVPPEVGEYCRQVEEHLARINEGHIIRIVGTAFEMVRSWAVEAIPLSIVKRGMEQKAERHRAGRSRRPLRLEFCESDVRALFEDWRRSVGAWNPGATDAVAAGDLPPALEERRKPSATRQLDRAIDRVASAAGRLDLPEGLPAALTPILDEMVALREALRLARGPARQALAVKAGAVDAAIGQAARDAAGVVVAEVDREARHDLAAFRDRLPRETWERSVRAGADRLLRERYGLPVLDLDLPTSPAVS